MLRVESIETFYGKVKVLMGVSMELKEGTLVAVLGANGAGKTTLQRTIMGITPAEYGEIEFLGRRIEDEDTDTITRLGISMVPEGRLVFTDLTVKENLSMGAYISSDREAIKKDMDKMLNIFPILNNRLSQKAGLLSGGEQQMLVIARGLMSNPKLLLLDEPSLGLSPLLVVKIFNIIQQIHSKGTPILLVEQNFNVSLKIADYVYIMEKYRKDVKVAFFYQDDGFGYDGLKGFRAQMKKFSNKRGVEVSYKRGAIDLSSHALKLKYANPDWVILHCLWGAGSKILKEIQKIGWQPQFMGISGTADPIILKLAGDAVNHGKPLMGVAINYPFDGDSLGAKEYRVALKKYQPDAVPGTFSMWGYGFAKILIEGLRRIKGEPTREELIMALETFKNYETGVFPPLTWGSDLRKGSKGGMIVVQKGKTFVPITGWRYVKK